LLRMFDHSFGPVTRVELGYVAARGCALRGGA
jgi:hypothetical protein